MNTNSTAEHCPCCSEKSFSDCCQPIIDGEAADNAEALMRSRYTAYATHQIDHLMSSVHPKRRKQYCREETKQWAEKSTWSGLDVVSHDVIVPNKEASVEFKAHYQIDGIEKIHHEKSLFKMVDGRWYFYGTLPIDKPNTAIKVGRNDPCHCGSGKKFKKCCGK